MLVPEIIDNGAISSLNLSNTGLVGEKRCKLKKAQPRWWNERDHGLYGEEDDNYDTIPDMAGVIAFANGIKDMRALSTLIFGDPPDMPEEESESDSEEEGAKKWEPAVLEVGMTEADFSSKSLGVGAAIIISAWISHKIRGHC
jgi:hypothetical protein